MAAVAPLVESIDAAFREVRQRSCLAIYIYKCIILPRQARDKHRRESTQKKTNVLLQQGFAAACVVAYESREHKLEEVCAFVTLARMSCWHDRSSESSSCCFVF
jgi:hypothetical protein